MTLQWTVAALADLAGILEHLPPEVAANTAARVSEAEQNIALFPHAAFFDEMTDTYEPYVPKTRLILIYHVANDVIEVISVFHTSREPKKKRKQ